MKQFKCLEKEFIPYVQETHIKPLKKYTLIIISILIPFCCINPLFIVLLLGLLSILWALYIIDLYLLFQLCEKNEIKK